MAASEHIQTDLDRDPEWWANWFEQDFSWEGLKKRPWRGWVVVDDARCMPEGDVPEGATIREATLQDYWRADPEADWVLRDLGEPGEADSQAELVRLEETVWHRVHLPPATRAGERSWKANPEDERLEARWAQVQADLQLRMKLGFETKLDYDGDRVGADGRAQLDGVVIKALYLSHKSKARQVHLLMAYSFHLMGIDAEKAHFGSLADFDSARFGGIARFASASFGSLANFNKVSFGRIASFKSASFGGIAIFDSASFGGTARFDSAIFGGTTRFDSAIFGGTARFDSAIFDGIASFDSADFGGTARFKSARFGSLAIIDNACFGSLAIFDSVHFGGLARFDSARFGGLADFDSARFGGIAHFDSANFGTASFISASFVGDARFERVSFVDNAWFDSANFGDDAKFDSASFGTASFESASFGGDAGFETAIFGGTASFNSAYCEGDSSFESASFGNDADFEGARFDGVADFESVSFGGDAGFETAIFGGSVRFESARFSGVTRFNRAIFDGGAWFKSAIFGGGADFESANFGTDVRFDSASFGGDALFKSASFGGYARFLSTCFGGDARFDSASFGGNARFDSAVFFKSADFQRGSASALAAGRLVAGAGDEAAIKAVTKAARASDYTLVLTHGAAKRETGAFQGFDFSRVRCLGDADFSDRGFGTAPDFQDSRFYGRADFHKADMHEGVRLTGAEFRLDDDLGVLNWGALVARFSDNVAPFHVPFGPHRYGPVKLGEKRHLPFWKAAYQAWKAYHEGTCSPHAPVKGLIKTASGLPVQLYKALRKPNPTAKPLSSHRHLDAPADYEASYRRLKRIMGGIGSHIEEQRFFALELIARQQRKDVNIWERRVAADYGLIADYGRSFVRPLMALAVVCVVMSGLYAGLAGFGGALSPPASVMASAQTPITTVQRYDAPPYTRPSVWARTADERSWVQDQFLRHQARKLAVLSQVSGPLVFAAEITLAPVANPVRHHGWALRLNEKGGAWSAAFSALRLIHRMLALPLIFLFALSLRRRFQLG